jgi:CheY-like chemotaxis protein
MSDANKIVFSRFFGGGMSTILVVDDTPDVLLLVRSLLEEVGHVVYTATNGVEALALAMRLHPRVILSDWMMPKMDGVALFYAVRAAAEIRDTPVILMTAGSPAPDVPVDAVLTKPFPIPYLFQLIERFTNAEN